MGRTINLKNFKFGNASSVGMVRKNNEDYFGYFETGHGFLFVVCDGMGGHNAGEVAAQLAVQSIKEFFNNPILDYQMACSTAIQNANQTIINNALENPDRQGMGTTAVVVLVRPEGAFWAHVGDSRLYDFDGANLSQISKDHSYVQGLVDNGILTKEEAEQHPRSNEITQALGIHSSVSPQIGFIDADELLDKALILCTDGLNGMLTDAEISKVLLGNVGEDPNKVSKALVDAANKKGGKDNVTVQLIQFYDPTKVFAGVGKAKKTNSKLILGAVLGLAVIFIVSLGLYILTSSSKTNQDQADSSEQQKSDSSSDETLNSNNEQKPITIVKDSIFFVKGGNIEILKSDSLDVNVFFELISIEKDSVKNLEANKSFKKNFDNLTLDDLKNLTFPFREKISLKNENLIQGLKNNKKLEPDTLENVITSIDTLTVLKINNIKDINDKITNKTVYIPFDKTYRPNYGKLKTQNLGLKKQLIKGH